MEKCGEKKTKVCTKCGETKEEGEFYKDKYRRGGRRSDCNKCNNKYVKEWSAKNRDKKRKNANKCASKKWATNKEFRYIENLKRRIRHAYKGLAKKPKSSTLIGISRDLFRKYIEELFTDDMTHENHGSVWHIDHVIPISTLNSCDPEQEKKIFHYMNLRPLCIIENRAKGDRVDLVDQLEHLAMQTYRFLGGEQDRLLFDTYTD